MTIKKGTTTIDDIVKEDYTNHLFRVAKLDIRVKEYISTNNMANIGYYDIYKEDEKTCTYVFYVRQYYSKACIEMYDKLYYNVITKGLFINRNKLNNLHIVFVYPMDVDRKDVIRLTKTAMKDGVLIREIFLSDIISNNEVSMDYIKNAISNHKEMSSYYIVAATILPLMFSDKNKQKQCAQDVIDRAKRLRDVKTKHIIVKEVNFNLNRFCK